MISLEESLQPLSKKQRLDTMNGTEHGSVAVSDSMTQCTICGHISCRASQLIESECHPKIQPKIKEFLTKNDIQCPKLIFGEQDNEWIVAAANLNCLLCDLKTNSVSELRLHLSNHDCSPISFSGLVNPMKYECKLCTSFVREDAFDRHKDNHVAKDEQFQVVELGDRVVLYGINIRKEKPLSISFQSTFKPVSLEKKIEAETRDVVKKPIRKIEMSSDESSSSSSNESNDSDFDSTSNSDSNDDDYNEKMESQQITKPSRRIAKVVYGECGTCGKLCNAERELQEVGITIHNSKYQNQRCFNSRSGCDNFSYYKQDEKWSVAAVNCSCGLCSHAARSYKAIAEHVFEEHGITIMHYTLLLEPKKCVCNLCHRYIPFKERDGHLKYHLRKQSDYKRVKLMQINGGILL
jgi:RNA polymerase-binding transcription factor DksA